MRWLWFYIQHRTQLGALHPVKTIQQQDIYMKTVLVALLVFVIFISGCSRYYYKSEQCEVSIISWSNLDVGSIDLVDCDVMGAAEGRNNVALEKALDAAILAAKAAK